MQSDLNNSETTIRAYDSILIEYRTVRKEPRVLFEHLMRTAFEACATLANKTLTSHSRFSFENARVQCGLEVRGPGAYLVSFEIPDDEPDSEPADTFGNWRLPHASNNHHPQRAETQIQVELLSATRLLEDLLLTVDTICSTPPGHLSVNREVNALQPMIELIDGIKVLKRIYPCSWDLLTLPEVQDLLRAILAPFQDPQLYTMSVQEVTPFGSLGTNWVITSNRQLCNFANGGRLEVPRLEPPQGGQ